MNDIERRIRSAPEAEIYESMKSAFPQKSDLEIVAELTRMLVIVAVCWNDVVEGGQDATAVFQRHIFAECDELAEFFPWPNE